MVKIEGEITWRYYEHGDKIVSTITEDDTQFYIARAFIVTYWTDPKHEPMILVNKWLTFDQLKTMMNWIEPMMDDIELRRKFVRYLEE